MPSSSQWAAAQARQRLYAAIRSSLQSLGYFEVETPALVAAPGMEPHISAFEVPFVPQTDLGRSRTLYLHTSPEYAMKRLLADRCGPIFQICKVFRNGEISQWHNPEFTMLELYRPQASYSLIMEDLEKVLSTAEVAVGEPALFATRPYERLTVRDALLRHGGVDLQMCPDAPSLATAVEQLGIRVPEGESFENVFFRVFLERVEVHLGHERPTFLIDYPAPMASLARLKPDQMQVAERFELYAKGVELANGFSELTDAVEQRRRLVVEQDQRRQAGSPVYPLDERFLAAVARMPAAAGVAVGLDRVLGLLLGAKSLSEVLLFPATELF